MIARVASPAATWRPSNAQRKDNLLATWADGFAPKLGRPLARPAGIGALHLELSCSLRPPPRLARPLPATGGGGGGGGHQLGAWLHLRRRPGFPRRRAQRARKRGRVRGRRPARQPGGNFVDKPAPAHQSSRSLAAKGAQSSSKALVNKLLLSLIGRLGCARRPIKRPAKRAEWHSSRGRQRDLAGGRSLAPPSRSPCARKAARSSASRKPLRSARSPASQPASRPSGDRFARFQAAPVRAWRGQRAEQTGGRRPLFARWPAGAAAALLVAAILHAGGGGGGLLRALGCKLAAGSALRRPKGRWQAN